MKTLPERTEALKSLLAGRHAACPACKKPLTVLAQNEGWTYCATCGFGGGIIEIGAAIWKCDLPTSAARLNATYGWQLMRKLQDALRRQIWHGFAARIEQAGPPPAALCRRFLSLSVRWTPGLALIADITDLLRGLHRRLDQEKDDNTALLIPFYSMPGRVCGVVAYFTAGGKLSAGTYLPLENKLQNAGVCLLSRTRQPVEFIFSDPVEAVSTALRWQGLHQSSLPVVGCWIDATRQSRAATSFPTNNAVLVGSPDNPETIKFASEFNVPVTTGQQMPNIVGAELAWLRKMGASTVPWLSLFSRYCDQTPDAAKLLMAGMRSESLAIAIKTLPPRLSSLCEAVNQRAVAKVHGQNVIATAGGWRTPSNNEFVCDHNLLIDQIVTTETGSFYRGRAFNNDQSNLFMLPADAVDRQGLFVAVRDCLRQKGAAVDLRFTQTWNGRAFSLACGLQVPKMVAASNRIGWNTLTKRLQLALFAIDNNGDIVYEPCLPESDDLPTASLSPSRRVDRLSDKLLLSEALWRLTAVVLWHVLQPASRQRPGMTTIVTEDLIACRELLSLLGCSTLGGWQHDWPTVCNDLRELARQPDNRIFLGDSLVGWVARAYGSRRVVIGDAPVVSDPADKHACSQIITAYLVRYCQKERTGRPLVLETLEDVVVDLQQWLRETQTLHTETFTVGECLVTRRQAVLLAVHQLWQRLPVGVVSRYDHKKNITWFCGEKLLKELFDRGLPTIPLEKLRQAFESSPDYAGEKLLTGSLECGICCTEHWVRLDPGVAGGRIKLSIVS